MSSNKVEVPSNEISDDISCLKFSPTHNVIAAGMWDGHVRVWNITSTPSTEAVRQIKLDKPVLSLTWTEDGSKIGIGCADNKLYLWDVGSGQHGVLGQHNGPVKTVATVKGANMIVSGGLDKCMSYWDLNKFGTAALVNSMPERVYSLDADNKSVVVGLADRNLAVYQLNMPNKPLEHMASPLDVQTKVVRMFTDGIGYAVGSVGGRVQILNIGVPLMDQNRNFSFKAHIKEQKSSYYSKSGGSNGYSVNGICFHPRHNTLVTGGANGDYMFWDKDSRIMLPVADRETYHLPITDLTYNHNGGLLGIAVSYDWSKGIDGYRDAQKKNRRIVIRSVPENSVRPRNKGRK